MLKQFIFLLFFVMVVAMANSFAQSRESLLSSLQELKSKYAPDRRTEIFDVTLKEENGGLLLAGETTSGKAFEALQTLLASSSVQHVTNQVLLLPATGIPQYGVITVSVANHRTEPKHSAEMATQSLMGTVVGIYKKEHDFSLVRTPDRYIAWVDNEALWFSGEDGANEWLEANRLIIMKPFLFISAQPSITSPVVADLVLGDIVRLEQNQGEWLKIVLPDGRSGFIPADAALDFRVWAEGRNPSVENVLKSAFSFTGVPYLWGGTSVKGLDCSGFTKTCFFLNGLIVPRDASQQVLEGQQVGNFREFEQLQAGDLLFFGDKDSVREKVTHVGIYIGNGEFIHETGKVRVNSFTQDAPNFSRHRFKQYLRAKRYLGTAFSAGIIPILKSGNYFRQVVQ